MPNEKCNTTAPKNTYDINNIIEIKKEKTYTPEEIAFYHAQQDLQYRKPKQ
jgi:hypothetical protein